MASQDVINAVTSAVRLLVQQPVGGPRILTESDEQAAIEIIDALESVGFEIVRRTQDPLKPA